MIPGDNLPPPGAVVLVNNRPHIVSYTACRRCGYLGLIPAGKMEPGGLLICGHCCHALICWVAPPDGLPGIPGGQWFIADLTAEQAESVERHPNFPNIRAMQERMAEQLGMWG